MKYAFLPFVFLLATNAGCPSTTPVPGAATCATVCAKGVSLNCVFATATPKGASCETFCTNLQASGLPKWDLACRTKAATCAAMDLCERGR